MQVSHPHFVHTLSTSLQLEFLNLLKLINYLFLAALGLHCCTQAFSSCGERGLLFVVVLGLLIVVASLFVEHRLQTSRLQQLWCTGLVAPRQVGSSQTRARTHVPCIGRQILNHCATRETLEFLNSCYYHSIISHQPTLEYIFQFLPPPQSIFWATPTYAETLHLIVSPLQA